MAKAHELTNISWKDSQHSPVLYSTVYFYFVQGISWSSCTIHRQGLCPKVPPCCRLMSWILLYFHSFPLCGMAIKIYRTWLRFKYTITLGSGYDYGIQDTKASFTFTDLICDCIVTKIWVPLSPIMLFTLSDGKHQRKKLRSQTQSFNMNGP